MRRKQEEHTGWASTDDTMLEQLRDRNHETDVHNLLRELAIKPGTSSEVLRIAKEVLDKREDDWWVQGAIYALTSELSEASRISGELIPYIDANLWEEFSNSAIAAISALGQVLSEKQDADLYRIILAEIKGDLKRSEEDSSNFWPVHLECLVRALDRGIRGNEAILYPLKIRTSQDIPKSLMAEAERRASRMLH